MPSRESPQEVAIRKALKRLDRTIEDIRLSRIGSGMSQRTLADHVGTSRSRISRVERLQEPDVPAALLARMGVFVGLDLVTRVYPGGVPISDAAHVRLLGRLRDRLGPAWAWQYEVGMPVEGDLRAWDAVGSCVASGLTIHVEAETRIDDVQSALRRLSLKRRDSGAARVVLLAADTRHNREVARAASSLFRDAFPADTRVALALLARGQDPGVDVMVLL
ncbi:MAG: helix-turn-helix transcriptional regulator [Chloroflexota bacterium]